MRETFSVSRLVSVSCRFIVRRSVKTACEREELKKKVRKRAHLRREGYRDRREGGGTYVSFMLVAATVRALFPSSMSVIISS